MSGLFGFVDGYKEFLKNYGDPRTAQWFLSGKVTHLMVILVSYVYFSTKAGPRYMKDRKPYDLKRTIQIYNILQIFASMYLVYVGLAAGWATDYNYACQPVVPGEKGMMMAQGVWLYFILKLTELLDTASVFRAEKKFNQVSFLHVYHHTLIPIVAWIGLTFLPGGHGTLLGLINSFIHVIMYIYYFLSSLGPQYQKYLWWKKYLTAMQMIQFCIIFIHNFQVVFRECDYPKILNLLMAIQAAYFLYLFGCFYMKQYVRGKTVKLDENRTAAGNEVAEVKSNLVSNLANEKNRENVVIERSRTKKISNLVNTDKHSIVNLQA